MFLLGGKKGNTGSAWPRARHRAHRRRAGDGGHPHHAGNDFLMRHGSTVVWIGWHGDVQPGGDRLTARFQPPPASPARCARIWLGWPRSIRRTGRWWARPPRVEAARRDLVQGPMVRRLSAGGSRIRTSGPSHKPARDSAIAAGQPHTQRKGRSAPVLSLELPTHIWIIGLGLRSCLMQSVETPSG